MTPKHKLHQRHLDEWVNGSGVNEEIARLNAESLDDPKEIAKKLNWRNYSRTPGWWTSGVDPLTGHSREFGQFKPDQPHPPTPGSDDKPAKYLTGPKGKAVEALFPTTDDPGYWPSIINDVSVPIAITEGMKKACAGVSAGIPTIALTGVWNGKVSKKVKLIPDLERFAHPGREITLAFDSDILVKSQVQKALISLGDLLVEQQCLVRVLLLPEETKGLDDYKVAHGSQALQDLIKEAVPFKKWSEQWRPQPKQSGSKPPKADAIATELVKKYRDIVAWNTESQDWYQYDSNQAGIWTREPEESVHQLILTELRSRPAIVKKFGSSYLKDIASLMKIDLHVKRWETAPGLLPLKNGVLNLDSLELLPHSAANYFTWSLPYDWNPEISHALIADWLLEAMGGDQNLVELLRAYLNAVVKGCTELQRFLECVGPGGTGKSTFIWLAKALVGEDNTFTTELKHLEANRFETAGIYGKRLVLITDAERYGGAITVLKAITGQDPLRLERKHQQQRSGFTPTAMVILASNELVQSSDYTSGLGRRRLTVPFLHQVDPAKRRDLQKEFKPHLPGLLRWVLELSDEQVTDLIRNTDRAVPSLTRTKLDTLCETNPMADWLNERVLHIAGTKSYVGTLKPGSDERFWLYPSYYHYCQETGSRPFSLRRFSGLLKDLCVNQLQWLDVVKKEDNRGIYFTNLSIRGSRDEVPRSITGQKNSKVEDDSSTSGELSEGSNQGSAKEVEEVEDYSKNSCIENEDRCCDRGAGKRERDPGETSFHENPPLPPLPLFGKAFSHSKSSTQACVSSTHDSGFTNWSSKLKVGDIVTYSGKNRNLVDAYSVSLTVYKIEGEYAICRQPNKQLTTHIPITDLAIATEKFHPQ